MAGSPEAWPAPNSTESETPGFDEAAKADIDGSDPGTVDARQRPGLNPLVSVVIPTRGRAALVLRAVRSALAQSYSPLEVVVVLDGPDPETAGAIDSLQDPRVRPHQLAETLGGAGARNAGVAAARGGWVALLDDDDEWLPGKLTAQMSSAAESRAPSPIVCSRIIARSPSSEYIWPRRLPRPGEPVAEYIFARRSLFQGEGLIQSTMIFAPRELFLMVPFTEGLPGHQDWDWIVRATAAEGAELRFVDAPLAIWYIEEKRASISRTAAWEESLAWIESRRDMVSRRAYAAFLMTTVSSRAALAGAWRAAPRILALALRRGRPGAVDIIVFLGIWLIPQRFRWWLRGIMSGRARA
jgi:glycosyltransferase involved in cell wall biosynthesis